MTSIFEYNEERAMKYIREDEYSKGVKSGREEGTQITLKVIKLYNKGLDSGEIAKRLELTKEYVEKMIVEYQKE